MKIFSKRGAIVFSFFVLCLVIKNGEGTLVSAAVITSFMSGFVMGKMSLGMMIGLLATMYSSGTTTVNVADGKATTTSTARNSIQEEIMRGKVLEELSDLDPLNCLPKAFCEINSDPELRSQVIMMKNEYEKDTEYSKEISNSEENVLDYLESFENSKIDSLALDDLISDSREDPVNSFYALDERMRNTFLKRPYFHRLFRNRIAHVEPRRKSPNLFSGDPFFKGFRTGRNFKNEGTRFNHRNLDIVESYNLAAEIGSNEGSIGNCRAAFPNCPYKGTEILEAINEHSDRAGVPAGVTDPSQKAFHEIKTSLQAIEDLNIKKLALNDEKIESVASKLGSSEGKKSCTYCISEKISSTLLTQFPKLLNPFSVISKESDKKNVKTADETSRGSDEIDEFKRSIRDHLNRRRLKQQIIAKLSQSAPEIYRNRLGYERKNSWNEDETHSKEKVPSFFEIFENTEVLTKATPKPRFKTKRPYRYSTKYSNSKSRYKPNRSTFESKASLHEDDEAEDHASTKSIEHLLRKKRPGQKRRKRPSYN